MSDIIFFDEDIMNVERKKVLEKSADIRREVTKDRGVFRPTKRSFRM